jgi:histidinol-phosphatase (PHP family)
VIIDYHIHLRDPDERIDHTLAGVERFVERARERAIDEIGFTEHVYYFRQTREIWSVPYQIERCVYDLDAYVGAVLEAKREGLPVKLGLEVDYVGGRQERLAELLEPYPWDYLLGSVHWIDGLAIDQEPGIWDGRSVEDVWRTYFGALGELAVGGFVDVLAHPDLVKIFGRRPAEPAAFYPADLGGVAIEISTAGLRKPVGELYPDPALLDGRPITLASDAHVPRLVGEDFSLALELARAAGRRTVTVFEGREARQEPLG